MRSTWHLPLTALLASTLLAGCMSFPRPAAQEHHSPDSPTARGMAKIDRLFPRALEWYEAVNADLLPKGRPLIAPEIDLAYRMGVTNPEKVRLVILETFPMPNDPELLAEARRHGMGSWLEGGRANGYLVMLKPRVAGNKGVLAHELVHVAQYERMGRHAFLLRYLTELEMLGYPRSPLEIEAYAKSDSEL